MTADSNTRSRGQDCYGVDYTERRTERIDFDYDHDAGKLLVFVELTDAERRALWDRIEDGHPMPEDAPARILEALGLAGAACEH